MIEDRHDKNRYSNEECYTCWNYMTCSGPESEGILLPSCMIDLDVQHEDRCAQKETMTEKEILEAIKLDKAILKEHNRLFSTMF